MRSGSVFRKIAGGVLIGWALAGCAGQSLSSGGSNSPAPEMAMAGRWILTAPRAPSCGMNFAGAAGASAGTVSPEGGCPGNFYLSRTWTLEPDALVINDDENNPIARLGFSGERFQGLSTTGTAVTLVRQMPTVAQDPKQEPK